MTKSIMAIALLNVLLTACFLSPPHIQAHVEAANFLNPNINRRPSPVVVTIYELKSATAFQQANFFALYNNPAGTLGNDLLDKHEIEIRPKQKLDIKQGLAADTKYIGIIAAFRNPDRAHWRHVVPVTPGSSVKLNIHLAMQTLSVHVN